MAADSKTAWGEIEFFIGTPGTGDVMSTSLTSLGYMKEDSVGIEKEDGSLLQLFGTGHRLIDELKGEPTLRLKGTLIGISDTVAQEFWDATASGSGDEEKTGIKSFVTSKKMSVKMSSKVVGSRTLEAPYCSVSLMPLFSEKEGWTAEIEFTILTGQTGYPFQFGIAPAPVG